MFRILIVDDTPPRARALAAAFTAAGFTTTTAANGAEALVLLGAGDRPFDAVTLDLNMPVMGGLELLERLRSVPNLPPVVVYSTDSAAQVQYRTFTLGAADHLVKGESTPEDVVERIRQLLEHSF